MGRVLARATGRVATAQIRHVRPVPPGDAHGLVADVYQRMRREFGMVAPPVVLHSPAPGSLAACWLMLRETLIATGAAGRAAKEAVAAAVSLANSCPYCVDVHGILLHGLLGGPDSAAIAGGDVGAVADPGLRAVAAWARATGTPASAAPGGPPVAADQAAELVGVAVVFHYLNRMVNVFLTESPLPPGVPATARARVKRIAGWLTRPSTRRRVTPGGSLDLLPAVPVPADVTWAAGNPILADAFARAGAAIDAGGRRSVPEPVRELVLASLAGWDGGSPGPSAAWAADAVTALPAAHRPAGRLALLTAIASYQVGPSVIDEAGGYLPDDRALVELTAWASWQAARRVGSWQPGSIPDRAT